ncbi:MAG: metallophosphatase family protein [Muribaculaceae bacterium]|nr:metallophosphatase family protein [Muribaculaceae bacterium]
MKKIGILSDTHSCWDDRYEKYFKDCDEIWHAGDIGDITILERLRSIGPTLRAVRGNIDHGEVNRHAPELLIFDIEDVKVLLTHIGGYPGRWSPGMKQLLKENHINLMVDGHSHILRVMYDKDLNLLHINPGAAGHHGWQKERTLIRLTIDGNDFKDCEVIQLGKE